MPKPFKMLRSKAWYEREYVVRGRGTGDIAAELGCSKEKVRKDLMVCEVALRPQSPHSGLHRLFWRRGVTSPVHAWALGLTWTDGTITKQTSQIRYRLSIDDRVALEQFRQAVGGPPLRVIPATVEGWKDQVMLQISSKDWVNDLARWGLCTNKDNVLPAGTQIPKRYLTDFVRGCIDGDGSLKWAGSGGTTPRLEFKNRNEWLLKVIWDHWVTLGAAPSRYDWQGKYPGIYLRAVDTVCIAHELYLRYPETIALARKREMARAFAAYRQ